ncbi:MAG: UPF0175 family protein [Chloroflexota bacterium]
MAAARARESLVLDLIREGHVSQGKAAQMLEVSRWQMLELMGKHAVASGPESAEDVLEEVNAAHGALSKSWTGGRQRQQSADSPFEDRQAGAASGAVWRESCSTTAKPGASRANTVSW